MIFKYILRNVLTSNLNEEIYSSDPDTGEIFDKARESDSDVEAAMRDRPDTELLSSQSNIDNDVDRVRRKQSSKMTTRLVVIHRINMFQFCPHLNHLT